jgi:hypothetical protein
MGDYASLVEHLSSINAPRIERSQKHNPIDVLVMGVGGTVLGQKA